MADPFEVRVRFTQQLAGLNASAHSAQKAALYALKYRDLDEDLHSCILEQLERSSMNNRANIMYFIEQLCEMAQRERALTWVAHVQRDILRIIDAVAPLDGQGGANVKVVRRVLQGLHKKGVLNDATMEELEACLREREADALPGEATPPAAPPADDGPAPASTTRAAPASATTPAPATTVLSALRPDRHQVEQRIEEDRERHKRLKEDRWGVAADELDAVWAAGSDVGEDDVLAMREEAEEHGGGGGVA